MLEAEIKFNFKGEIEGDLDNVSMRQLQNLSYQLTREYAKHSKYEYDYADNSDVEKAYVKAVSLIPIILNPQLTFNDIESSDITPEQAMEALEVLSKFFDCISRSK